MFQYFLSLSRLRRQLPHQREPFGALPRPYILRKLGDNITQRIRARSAIGIHSTALRNWGVLFLLLVVAGILGAFF